MEITKIIRKSHRYNEDRIITGKNFFMVCDGATALYKTGIKPTEASWLVSFIKKHIPHGCTSVIDELNKISKLLYNEFVELCNKENLDPKNVLYLPSSGIALAEFKDDFVYIYTIGDCEAVVKTKDKKIIRHVIPDLIKLDSCALEKIVDRAKALGISIKQATKLNEDILIKNRQLMNMPNGYPVFTLDKEPNFKFLKVSYKVKDLEQIYLYSDGFAIAFDELKLYPTYLEMFAKDVDIKEEVDKIVKRSYSDASCDKYPRFKTIDDISVVKINL